MQHIFFILKRKNITLNIYYDIEILIIIISNIKNMFTKSSQNPLTLSTIRRLAGSRPKLVILLLLYLYISIVNKGVSQTYNKNPKYLYAGSKIESLNSLKQGKFYLLKNDSSFNFLGETEKALKIVKRLLDSSCIVFFEASDLYDIELNSKYLALYEIENGWKISKNITLSDNDYLNGDYWVEVIDDKEWGRFENSEARISTISRHRDFVKIKVKDVKLSLLLDKAFITYIEKVSEPPNSEARVLDLNLHPNKINTIQAYYPELNGASELVSIKEQFYNINDIDLSGRYIFSDRESEFSDSHPLEMATIIAGNGNTFLTGLGVAPNVLHTSSSNNEVTPDPKEYFTSNSIQTQNHSYGTEIESFYGVAASLYDQQIYENPQIVHVFSIGNSGLEASNHGIYEGLTGFSNLTGNFKQAKNVLTIGAVDTSMTTIQLNSNGPAFDGRIKPELVAYSMTGTSNSAALISGVSVLLQQSYRNIYNSNISASLVKALLINSADDIGELGPEHKTGFGSLNAYQAVQSLEKGQFIEDQIINNQKSFIIKIPDNAVNFKATLVWTDPPAEPNDEIALVHDLNLQAQNESGQTYLPWILSTEPNIDALNTTATKGIDHLNNIEQLHIDVVNSDSIEIIINTEIPLDIKQAFSIVYGWEIENDFSWTSPTFKDNIPYNGETTSHLRWESSYSKEKAGKLYFKLIAEQNWELIEEEILLSDENFRWDSEIVNDFAQLKMEIDNQTYISDTFSISEPLRLNVGFNCNDSLSFYWKSIPDSDYYSLFHLIDNEMKVFANTQDTSLTINKSELSSSFLKVQAFKKGKALIQGGAIDYNLQSSNCFLESYFVESIQGEGIYHYLKLSSLTGVEKIHLEKKNEQENFWEILAEFNSNSFEVEYLENEPDNGFNSSRAVIYFINGESVISEIQSAYYVKSSNFIVYPNPLFREEDLKVFAKETAPEAIITFYNLQGQVLFSTSIPNDRNFLDLDFLSPGIYFYKITDKDQPLASGKFLMQY